MRALRKFTPLAAIAVLLSGCNAYGPKAQIGGLGGAAAGGLIASQVSGSPEAIAAGVILGGLFGGAVGNSLDNADRQYMQQTSQQSLEYAPSGQTAVWRNPDSGNSGTITPVSTYQTSSGGYCREYQQTVQVGGQSQDGYGTACRQPDGSWKVM